MLILRTVLLSSLACTWVACGAVDASEEAETQAPDTAAAQYDLTVLQQYRTALPTTDDITAPTVGDEADPNALTLEGDAELAKLAARSARDINRPARLLVATLKVLTQTPPSHYDEAEGTFTWGPWKNEEGYGSVVAFIKKADRDADFEYEYGLVRLADDEGSRTPVIWGGATPSADDVARGTGVALWDFEANWSFEKTYDPEFDAETPHDRGRFVTLFGRGENDEGRYRFNVAVFRNFTSKDAEPDAGPVDLEYYYGHFRSDSGDVLDFVDWDLSANLCGSTPEACFENATASDLETGKAETLSLSAAFANRRQGRAEATISGGDLDEAVDAIECWNRLLGRTYLSYAVDGTPIAAQGACAAPFDLTLAELGIPTLDDIDPEILAKMDCAATNGAVCTD